MVTGFPDNFASISAFPDLILAIVLASRNEGKSASELSIAERAAPAAACLRMIQSNSIDGAAVASSCTRRSYISPAANAAFR